MSTICSGPEKQIHIIMPCGVHILARKTEMSTVIQDESISFKVMYQCKGLFERTTKPVNKDFILM